MTRSNLYGFPFRLQTIDAESEVSPLWSASRGLLRRTSRESQNLLRTKSRSASSASLRDNFSRAVTLNTRIPRLWTEFQVLQYSRRSPKILSGRDARSPVDFDYLPVHLTSSSCRLFISHHTIPSDKRENADVVVRTFGKIFAAR